MLERCTLFLIYTFISGATHHTEMLRCLTDVIIAVYSTHLHTVLVHSKDLNLFRAPFKLHDHVHKKRGELHWQIGNEYLCSWSQEMRSAQQKLIRYCPGRF